MRPWRLFEGVEAFVIALLLLTGGPVAAAALYLLLLSIAASRYRPPALSRPLELPRVLVLVPAHNEEALIARCLFSLTEQTYPHDLVDVVVIADNSTDGTADIATAFEARVLTRTDTARVGKGHALRWAIDRLLDDGTPFDAVVVVDADSVLDPGMIEALVAEVCDGAEVAQAEYLALDEPDQSPGATLRSLALLLFHRVRFRGRAVLGLPCHLVGNGMLFTRRQLEQHAWNAVTSAEDLEHSVDLRLAGVPVRFAGGALVRAPLADSIEAADTQRARWEGGRWHVVRTRVPLLVRGIVHDRRGDLIDELADLVVPPLGLLVTASSVGCAVVFALVAVGAVPLVAAATWVAALGASIGFVLTGMHTAGASLDSYASLVRAPLLVLSTLGSRLRLVKGFDATSWVRTQRANETTGDHRETVAGVPVDAISMSDAVARVDQAIRERRFMQICTVNLDFLVNAHRHRDVGVLLRQSELNLPDGAPVVWLVRLLGRRIPGRVAGADLVPALCDLAARRGHRVFLLGGEGGTAERAAVELVKRFPGLQIAGFHEPPRAPLDEIDSAEILRRISDSNADIVFVALGHPKQDRWITAERAALTAFVAAGVGCTFDLLAGDQERAPGWMRRHGLEWLFRVVNEPRRLGLRYLLDAWWLVTVFLPGTLLARLRAAAEHG